jgi:hypothetical protein
LDAAAAVSQEIKDDETSRYRDYSVTETRTRSQSPTSKSSFVFPKYNNLGLPTLPLKDSCMRYIPKFARPVRHRIDSKTKF